MNIQQLETAIARTGHERLRWLTSDENPDIRQRDRYRRIVREIADNVNEQSPEPTPMHRPTSTDWHGGCCPSLD